MNVWEASVGGTDVIVQVRGQQQRWVINGQRGDVFRLGSQEDSLSGVTEGNIQG